MSRVWPPTPPVTRSLAGHGARHRAHPKPIDLAAVRRVAAGTAVGALAAATVVGLGLLGEHAVACRAADLPVLSRAC